MIVSADPLRLFYQAGRILETAARLGDVFQVAFKAGQVMGVPKRGYTVWSATTVRALVYQNGPIHVPPFMLRARHPAFTFARPSAT